MKKIIAITVLFLSLLIFIPKVEAKGLVKVYVFTKQDCPACATAEEFLNNKLKENTKLFDFVEIETFSHNGQITNQKGYELMTKALTHFGEDAKNLYTPTIVVGEKIQVGANDLDVLYDYIKECKDSDTIKDVVEELAKENNISISEIRTNQPVETTNKYDFIILVGIFVVLIGGFAGLVFIGKK